MDPQEQTESHPYRPGIDPDRRKGPDPLIQFAGGAVVVSWLLLVISLIILSFAKPPEETIFDRMYQIAVRRTWDMNLLQIIFQILVFGFVTSLAGLIFNALRNRRISDRIHKSLILITFASLVGMLVYLLI